MIVDARAADVVLDRAARIVIVGSGPAGLTLARELAGVGPVLVIESGGLQADPAVQALCAGECAGMDYPLAETRARQFGGSSALWAGFCATFDHHDFQPRDWVSASGWPFGPAALEPHYARAAELLILGAPHFDARDIAARAGVLLPFDDGMFVATAWRFGTPKLEIGEQWRVALQSSADITVLTHANVVELRLDAQHSTVTELVVRTLDGREGRVAADLAVLACGGIETPRLLLNSDAQLRHGIGNAGDHVGRYFMEHPHLPVSGLELRERDWFRCFLERGAYDDDRQFLMALGLSPAKQATERVLNARAHIYRTPDMSDHEAPRLGLFLEQAPSRHSRVTLSNQRDALGMRRVRLDWRLTDLDWRTHETTGQLLAREFERLGAGHVREGVRSRRRDTKQVLYSNHHLGTTRMSALPADGVVDPDCRVHDIANLYIAGGGVFPTVSWANPTFTVVALTLRLAEHLRGEMAAGDAAA